MAQIMTYNSSLENYVRAGILTKFIAFEAIEAGDMVYLGGDGQIRKAVDPMLLWGRGGISGVAERKAAAAGNVLVWQTGVFEFTTSVAQAILPGRYVFVTGATTVDLGGGTSQEISAGVAESGTSGSASGEIVEVFITPTRKRSPYLYDHPYPYL